MLIVKTVDQSFICRFYFSCHIFIHFQNSVFSNLNNNITYDQPVLSSFVRLAIVMSKRINCIKSPDFILFIWESYLEYSQCLLFIFFLYHRSTSTCACTDPPFFFHFTLFCAVNINTCPASLLMLLQYLVGGSPKLCLLVQFINLVHCVGFIQAM